MFVRRSGTSPGFTSAKEVACHTYRPQFELLGFTGLRIGEALGLWWEDVGLDAGITRVHRQLSRHREHAR